MSRRVNPEKLYEIIPILKEIQALLPERPLTFLDIEATGVYVEIDRIVELFMIRIDNPQRVHVFHSLFNPGIPIPKEASDIHKITDEMVKNEGLFAAAYDTIVKYLENSVLCGYNSKAYDVKILQKELDMASPMSPLSSISVADRPLIDMYKIWAIMEKRTLSDAYKRYTGKELTDAHTASDDVFASAEIFLAQLKEHEWNGNRTVDDLAKFCEDRKDDFVDLEGKLRWRDKDIVFSFGEKRGQSVTQHKGYLSWMLRAGFHEDTKRVIRDILSDKFPVRPVVTE